MPTAAVQDSIEPTAPSPERRRLFKTLAILPVAAGAAALGGCEADTRAGAAAAPAPYRPSFFDAAEWTALGAIADRLVPRDDVGPSATDLGVPEFLDRHMQTPYAAGDIWYRQGPFLDASANFGYQGRLALREILKVGLGALQAHVARAFGGGKTFATLAPADQDAVLKGAEAGTLKWPEISDKLFFAHLLNEVRNGCFADPRHGGNRDMGGWKMIGYPGMRADYLDWVGVRDRPYPIPPVDLAGRRG